MYRTLFISTFICFISLIKTYSQNNPTSPDQWQKAIELKKSIQKKSLVQNLKFENIGPSVMSGRVVDVAVNPVRPTEFFVAYASGGLWYTDNNGTSFTPVMDATSTQNIGDIDIHWPSGTIWVGTGENNSSRSSYAGIGMLKSEDKGKTWKSVGLFDSHHIGRVLINPDNREEVVVAVTGHLYSPSSERGIYKTSDGGQTWNKTLFINEDTGIIDLETVQDDFKIMYAASWEREREAWNFKGNGSGSAIYKSIDAGNSWAKITSETSGFPVGAGVGRIGLTVSDAETIYAFLDNQDRREAPEKSSDPLKLTKDDFKRMTVSSFLELENSRLNDFLKSNGFQEKYRAENVKQMVRSGTIQPAALSEYLENANAQLFDTPVIGAEVYRSDDGGKTWNKTHEGYLDDLYYSYGYYFGQIRVAPYNKNQIYILGVPILRSDDAGKSFVNINGANVHSDHHALWINPDLEGHLINGNDGGINISYDFGKTWIKNNSPTVGQFYAITVDQQDPYYVYGGLQDNGVWMGPNDATESDRWHASGNYPWKSILGGDGMQVQVDRRNSNLVYTGFQFGNYFRINLEDDSRTYIQPKHDLGEKPYRFNWQTPILLSPHNQDILYLGGNKLHRSMDQGENWTAISEDLTKGSKPGNVAFGTLTTISESPFEFGSLYTGSDDGLIYYTPDGGNQWQILSQDLPQNLWVSRVVASKHKKERVYVTLNGYRWDDFTPYIYLSDDYGKSWKSISSGVPASPVNVILEDPMNEDLLFAGTDNGLYVSFNRGASWEVFQNGIPEVAIHDLAIQEREKELVVGTHGRSIYKISIKALQQLSKDQLNEKLVIFELDEIKHSARWGNSYSAWSEPNTPGLDILFFTASGGEVNAKIQTLDGILLSETQMNSDKGFNVLSYDVAFSKKGKSEYLKKYKTPLKEASDGKTYLPKGTYEVELEVDDSIQKGSFTIK